MLYKKYGTLKINTHQYQKGDGRKATVDNDPEEELCRLQRIGHVKCIHVM